GESAQPDHLLALRPGHSRPGGRQVGVRPGGRQRPGAAPGRLLPRGRAMSAESTAIGDRRRATATGTERVLAEVLADVLRVDRARVVSNCSDALGADRWVMAHFCARVRKRGALPPVSMKDVYAPPTIRALAAALADVARGPAKSAVAAAQELPTPTRRGEYV